MPIQINIYHAVELEMNAEGQWSQGFAKALNFRLAQFADTFDIQLVQVSEHTKVDLNTTNIWLWDEVFLTLPNIETQLSKPHPNTFFVFTKPISNELMDKITVQEMYSFYKIDYETELVQVYEDQKKTLLHLGFWSVINDLAADIIGKRNNRKNDFHSKIYLAQTGDDILEFRAILRRELSEYGYEVVPDRQLPFQTIDCMEAINDDLEGCQLSIHLFGGYFDEKLDDEHLSLSALQNTLAAQKSNKEKLNRLIWMPPKLTVEDERQEEIIRDLRQNPKAQVGAELLETSIEELKFAIHERLKELE